MNLLDYLEWRGDLTFEQSPFCEVDALILCQLSYLNFDTLVSPELDERISVETLWKKFKTAPDFESRSDLGALISKLTVTLLELCALSERFKKIEASAYINKIDLQNEEQFSAITFFRNAESKNPFVAFRGTDDTIVGWKEDFNLASKIVPAQHDALEYLAAVVQKTQGDIFVGGHSKGGNLALYSCAFLEKKIKTKIGSIYNFDGPGFSEQVVQSAEMQEIIPRLHSFYPKFSIVGRLFHHGGEYEVVNSEASGIMQHDAFSWHTKARGFETLEDFDKGSEIFYKTFNEWVESLSAEKRVLFVETLFTVIEASGARTNSELEKNWFSKIPLILGAMTKVDKETRNEVTHLLGHFVATGAKNIKQN